MRPMLPNVIQEGDGFYISYNNTDIGPYGSDTTALVLGQMQAFYILNGDHRRQYRPLIAKGFEACLAYFSAHPDQQNALGDKA